MHFLSLYLDITTAIINIVKVVYTAAVFPIFGFIYLFSIIVAMFILRVFTTLKKP